jgi:anaerobic selenocysteine-containing dehydrogenase
MNQPIIVRSACPHDCPDTCAMLSTVVDGKVTAVRGDPKHPFTRGALCPKVRDYEQRTYHRERILHPLRRIGAKGSAQFERISWDDALAQIGARYTDIIGEYGAEAILPCNYLGQQGLLNGLHCGDPFFNQLGASVAERTFCNAGATLAYNMTLGPTAGLDPESFVHAEMIIIWGCNIVGSMPHHWPFIREAQRNGTQLVVIDPVRSRTAAHADTHIQPRPGTDVALALGMMRVIIAENRYDADYVAQHLYGFEELRARVERFTPEYVEATSGVSQAVLVQLARDYAATSASAIRVGVAIERSANGPDTVRAVSALPTLTGAWRHVGGGIFQNSIRAFPIRREALARPDLIRADTRVVNLLSLGKALTGALELDPPIKALFVYNCNPVSASPEQALTVRGLMRGDLFTVVSEQFMTDTARYADIVLPATTQLEQFDLMYSWGQFYLALNQAAIAPLEEAVSNTELFRRLAKVMGFDDPFFARSDQQIAESSMDWDHPSLLGITLDSLQQTGWARLNVGDASTRLPHAEGGFPTPTGKCEIVSTAALKGTMVLPIFRQGYEGCQEGAALDPLPDYVEVVHADEGEQTLALISSKAHFFLNSCYANFDKLHQRAGQQWAMLHPADAHQRGIVDGDTVKVSNSLGDIRARARLSEDALEGVIVVPHGYWRGADSASVNLLTADRLGKIGRAPGFSDTRVNVAKI